MSMVDHGGPIDDRTAALLLRLRRQFRPKVRIFLQFRFRAATRAPVRLWQGGAWCLPPTANQN